MDFRLFILLNALLLIRPVDLFPEMGALPIYEALILACTALSANGIRNQLTVRSLSKNPVTVCMFGMLGAVILSNFFRLNLYDTRSHGEIFAKIVLYYLVAVSTLNTPQRLRSFVGWLVLLITVLASLALLHHHEIISIPSLDSLNQREYDDAGDEIIYTRLRAIGIFNDPNDLAAILDVAIVLSLFLLTQERNLVFRGLGLVALGVCGYAFTLTQSRGGLLGLMAGLLTLFYCRYGWKKSIVLGAVSVPAILLLIGGRQAELSTGTSTASERIGLWKDGLEMLKQSPLFGIGAGQYVENFGLVAHNSYVHCFVELGVLGGTMFVGCWYSSLSLLKKLSGGPIKSDEAGLARVSPFILAALVAYMIGLISLSRVYVGPTYLLLALATSLGRIKGINQSLHGQRGEKQILRIGLASCVVLGGLHLFVRLA